MRARLVTTFALAVLVSSPACGHSDGEPVHVDPLPTEVALPQLRPLDDEPVPAPERNDALPPAFPHDIPIPEGLEAKSVQSEHAGSYAALFTGDLEPEAVYRFFIEHLEDEGWTIDKVQGVGPEYGLFASKGGRITTVISTLIDGRLHVELGVSGGL